MNISSEALVTARVPDIVPPSIPILIAPEDRNILTDSTPTFIWNGSTDNVGVDHYDFWLNGVLQDTALYTVVVDEIGNTLSLTLKQAIADGLYSWNIVATDAANNTTSSAIWAFTLDTRAPNLSITKVEDTNVLITTENSQTLPTSPIVVKHKDPLISGLGEPSATLVIILTIPGHDTVTTTYVLGAGGTWSFQFPKLDKNVLATLTLIIEDQAGHTNILSPVQFIYKPTDGVGTTPTTGTTTDLVIERGKDNVSFITLERKPFWEWLSPVLLVLPTILVVLKLIATYGTIPDTTTLKLIWWWFGYKRKQKPDGEVHDRGSLDPLCLIPIQATNCQTNRVQIVSVTDRSGGFVFPQLDSGEYLIEPKWDGLQFPSIAKRPQSLPWHRFYLGEKVTYDKELPWPFLHIPVERLRKQSKWERHLVMATEWRGPLVWLQAALIICLLIASPSLITSIPFVVCIGLGFFRVFYFHKSIVTNKSSLRTK